MSSGQDLTSFIQALAARQATPGGGAAAGIAAALGAACGAMACAYTSGKRWAAAEAEAQALAEHLRSVAAQALQLAEQDQAGYARLQASWKLPDGDPEKVAAAAAARAIPLALLQTCAQASQALSAFRPKANTNLISDVDAGLYLLAGAAGAAWATLCIGEPSADEAQLGKEALRSCQQGVPSL